MVPEQNTQMQDQDPVMCFDSAEPPEGNPVIGWGFYLLSAGIHDDSLFFEFTVMNIAHRKPKE
jgi:hypothetical protein